LTNKWIEKSIELANSEGYLDKLSDVYPVTLDIERPLSEGIKDKLKTFFDKKDRVKLIEELIKMEKFPIKDPYVAFLKRNPSAIKTNPKTIERITNTLFSMGFEEMIKGIEEPKEFNRKIGTLFKKYIPKIGYPVLPEFQFNQFKGIAILKGSDRELMNYANSKLGCNLGKGLDILVKVNNKFIIGEAKFLTDFGGHQNAQFEDGLRLIENKDGNAVRIAILDGVVWIKGNNKMHRRILKVDDIALSSLLLKDFIETFR